LVEITFTIRREIMRDGIRVGWIDDRDDVSPEIRWRVRFTPASGCPGILGAYSHLNKAKAAATAALED
jgi:hypothetical protein